MRASGSSLFLRLMAGISAVLVGGAALLAYAASNYADRAAQNAYDRLLVGAAEQIRETLRVEDGAITTDIPVSAFVALSLSRQERVFYRVVGPAGETLTGYDDLPAARDAGAPEDVWDATYRDAFASGANTVAAGNQIAGTQRSSAWAQAAWQPGGAVPGELALEWRASAKTAANDTNTEFSPGYAIANLRWSARFNLGTSNALELLARVDNLFDRVYSGSVIVNDGNGRYYETGSPRAGLLSVRWLHRW